MVIVVILFFCLVGELLELSYDRFDLRVKQLDFLSQNVVVFLEDVFLVEIHMSYFYVHFVLKSDNGASLVVELLLWNDVANNGRGQEEDQNVLEKGGAK